MKFFGWMQNKLNGTHSRTSTSSASSHHVKQEPRGDFNDWPHAMLTIGTLGTTRNSMSESRSKNVHEEIEAKKNYTSQIEREEEPSFADDLEDFTPEEVGKLQKELMKLLSRNKKRKSDVNRELMNNLPLDRFLNCPSSLEVERRLSNALCAVVDSSEENKEADMERIILGKCKEINLESKNNNQNKRDISKNSVSYLLKKIFVCSDGFSTSPSPSLRDTLQESRMEKLLKMMLHKKINAQASSKPTSLTTKRYLQEKKLLSLKSEEEKEETNERRSSNDGYKWVKTDSDFIVLEI